jgi:hypothetical protein
MCACGLERVIHSQRAVDFIDFNLGNDRSDDIPYEPIRGHLGFKNCIDASDKTAA